MVSWPRPPACVLFDLDGTLVDSAPAMYAALVVLCHESDVVAPPFEVARERVSQGGVAVLRTSFPGEDDDALRARLPRYLDIYAGLLDRDTVLFPGVAAVLDALDARAVPWGIVTNKPGFLTRPVLANLGLATRIKALVAGDTLPTRKPDPEPILDACRQAGVMVDGCVYVGDDARDVQAAHAAGVPAFAVAWGYLDGPDPRAWGADAVAADARELADLLGVA